MKTLKQIREEMQSNLHEAEDNKKLTTLIRAGLFDVKKLPLLKRAMSKDNTKMSSAERGSLLDLLDTLIAHVTGDQTIFNKLKKSVKGNHESVNEAYEVAGELPMVLILKRRSIRSFPDGQRVALYWVDKLKTFISVPYSASGVGYSPNVSEDVEPELINFKILSEIISEETPKTLVFDDGSEYKCGVNSAKAIYETFSVLVDENKDRMLQALQESKDSFVKMADLSMMGK